MIKLGKMYSHLHGIVDVQLRFGRHNETYPYGYTYDENPISVSSEGKHDVSDKYPLVISLEQAEKQGLVRKKSTSLNRKRVKYSRIKYAEPAHKYEITFEVYASEQEFIDDLDYRNVVNFVSFVDEKLNECEPPQVIIEWEEV